MDEHQTDESLSNHNIDILLDFIAKSDVLIDSNEYPMAYDYSQPAKR